MPKPRHQNEPIQAADGELLDEEEVIENAEEELENNPDKVATELDEEGIDADELDQ